MSLLVVQLLFHERVDDDVRLDVIVLERAAAPTSPPVGQPISFTFALPRDPSWQAALERLLARWAEAMKVVHVDVVERHGHSRVRFAAADTSFTLEPTT